MVDHGVVTDHIGVRLFRRRVVILRLGLITGCSFLMLGAGSMMVAWCKTCETSHCLVGLEPQFQQGQLPQLATLQWGDVALGVGKQHVHVSWLEQTALARRI